jgi:Na+/melibiose symporter-like transporter
MKKLWKRIPKRFKRVAAFALGAGIAFLGAGAVYSMPPLQSALFGATGSILGLVMALSFTYAGKGEVPDRDFDSAINASIEAVASKTKDKDVK